MAGTFDTKHPGFVSRREDWELAAHALAGERRIKAEGARYLPVTSGQWALGMGYAGAAPNPGQLLYNAYLERALFPDIVRQTAKALIGVMVREPWIIELPPQIEYMRDRATARGETLHELIERILENVLLAGRIGLLNDVRESTNEIYISDYSALRIINWDDTPPGSEIERDLQLVVLDESRSERSRDSFEWGTVEQFRALELPNDVYSVRVERDSVVEDRGAPSFQNDTLDFIPFTFINATDLSPEPGDVPLLGLARLCVSIYRAEADYRHSLFMQGQDTLVLSGVANPNAAINRATTVLDPVTGQDVVPFGQPQTGDRVIVGAGAVIYLPDPNSDAKFIGVESKGLEEQRQALENDYQRAETFGLALLTSGNEAEASKTISTRVTARTASLASIVRTAAQGLRQQLRWCAEWAGANPDDVKVEENTDFFDSTMAPAELLQLIAAKNSGFPASWATLHKLAERGGLTNLSMEDELAEIDEEVDLALSTPAGESDPDPSE